MMKQCLKYRRIEINVNGSSTFGKICFRNEGKIKTFLDEGKLREFTMQVIIRNYSGCREMTPDGK